MLVDGMRGFVPASQFSQEYLGKMDKLVDKTFKAQVIEVDREQNRLILARRLCLRQVRLLRRVRP